MLTERDEKTWDPAMLFNNTENSYFKFALLILNQPILLSPDTVISLWNRAVLRITVDGGTDSWLQFCSKHNVENTIPDLITGDLDSVNPKSVEHLAKLGSKVVRTPDQNETDFTKALKQTVIWLNEKNITVDCVVALVETAGRLDHILANLNAMFRARSIIQAPVYQLANNSISWLLSPGLHTISIPESLAKGHCSLVPIGEPCTRVLTTGLKWNLENQCMQFGSLVSTSNAFSNVSGGPVTVDTDTTLLWTIEIENKLQDDKVIVS